MAGLIPYLVVLLPRLILTAVLPIVNDEAIYLHWADVVRIDPRFWSLMLQLDGKPPGALFAFAAAEALIRDPLWAGRTVSLLASLVAFGFGLRTVRLVWGPRAVWPFTVLTAVTPFAVFFGSLALQESLVTAAAAAALYFSVRSWNYGRWRDAVFLGIALAAGWWIKPTILLLVPGLLLGAGYGAATRRWKPAALAGRTGCIAGIWLVAALPVLINPSWSNASPLIGVRMMTAAELIRFPVRFWLENLNALVQWTIAFAGVPLVMLAVAAVRRNLSRTHLVLTGWFLLAACSAAAVSKTPNSRYLALAVPGLLVAAAGAVPALRNRIVRAICILVAAVPVLVLIVSPVTATRRLAPLPKAQEDLAQYTAGDTSGYGVREAVDWLVGQGAKGQIGVAFVPDSGTPDDAVYLYARNSPGVSMIFADQVPAIAARFTAAGRPLPPLYLVTRADKTTRVGLPVREKFRFPRPLGAPLILWEIVTK
jgi:hypothetical protein